MIEFLARPSDCLIECPDHLEIHRMALELHFHSRRYAFVEYHDLDRDCRLSLIQLVPLGPINLFIPEILSLTEREQEVLCQLVLQPPAARPLLLVGTTTDFSALRTHPGVQQGLLNLIARAYIKLNRPFSEYRARGLAHYFLDSFSSSPT